MITRFVRWLLHRPVYPRVVEGVLSSGRRSRFTIRSDPSTWPDVESPPVFRAPITVAPERDDDWCIEHKRPKLFPPLAVQIAGWNRSSRSICHAMSSRDLVAVPQPAPRRPTPQGRPIPPTGELQSL